MTELDYEDMITQCEDIEARPHFGDRQLYFDFFREEGDAGPLFTVRVYGTSVRDLVVVAGGTEIESDTVRDAAWKTIKVRRPDTFFIMDILYEEGWPLVLAPDLRRLMEQTPADFADWQDELPEELREEAGEAYLYISRAFRARLRRSRRT